MGATAVVHGRLRGLSPPEIAVPLGIALGTCGVLLGDAVLPSRLVQAELGLIALLTLVLLTRRSERTERHQVWTCVAVATCIELFGSVFWGVYRYRLGGVPLYVPPGHGLVYLAGLRLAASPLFTSKPRLAVRLAVVAAGIWAVAGLTLLPLLGQRADVLGAFFFVYFAVFALRTRRGPFFAAIFILTSLLEIAGTALGDWTWAVHAPGILVPVGNPPSVIAGGYCCIDATGIVLLRLYHRYRGQGLARGPGGLRGSPSVPGSPGTVM